MPSHRATSVAESNSQVVAPPAPSGPRRAPLLSRFFALRRMADKLSRQLGALRGKPDNSPWILRPAGLCSGTTYVDFLFGLDYLGPRAHLVRLFQEAMAPYGLSLLLVNQTNIERVQRDVARGWLRPRVYLDLCSATDPRFGSLLQTCADQGIHAVGDPSVLPTWTLKAQSHPRLEQAGLPVPPTIILGRDEPDRALTDVERARVGERCVIKPSFGVAGRGAVVGIAPTAAEIAQARNFNRQDDWLIQKMIEWKRYGPRAAYLRAYHVLGHRTLLWWAKEQGVDKYAMVTWEDFHRYDLMGAVDLIDRIAALNKMEFFASEIAITADSGPGRFVLIDYVNDQCDMDPDSGPGKHGLPEMWVKWVCGKFAQFVWRAKHRQPPEEGRGLWLWRGEDWTGPGPQTQQGDDEHDDHAGQHV